MIEQLIVSWEIKTAANGEKKKNSLLVIGFVLTLWLVWGLEEKKREEEEACYKGNKGVRRHKGRLSTFHRAHKRKKSLLQLITAELMKEKRRENPVFLPPERR